MRIGSNVSIKSFTCGGNVDAAVSQRRREQGKQHCQTKRTTPAFPESKTRSSRVFCFHNAITTSPERLK